MNYNWIHYNFLFLITIIIYLLFFVSVCYWSLTTMVQYLHLIIALWSALTASWTAKRESKCALIKKIQCTKDIVQPHCPVRHPLGESQAPEVWALQKVTMASHCLRSPVQREAGLWGHCFPSSPSRHHHFSPTQIWSPHHCPPQAILTPGPTGVPETGGGNCTHSREPSSQKAANNYQSVNLEAADGGPGSFWNWLCKEAITWGLTGK